MSNIIITGDWLDNGYLAGWDYLVVTIDAVGTIRDQDPSWPGEILRCTVYGADGPIISNGCWTFSPDEAALGRAGIVPVRVK